MIPSSDIKPPDIRLNLWALIAVTSTLLLTTSCGFINKERFQHHLQSGIHYYEQEKYSEAYIELQNAVQQNNQIAEPHYYLGMLASRQNRWHEAFVQLNQALRLDPKATGPRLELAELLIANHQIAEARNQISQVQATDPNNLRAQLLAGRASVLERDFVRGVAEFEKAKQMAPGQAIAWTSCGFAQLGAHRYEEAEINFHRALDLEPGVEEYRNMANILRLRGREDEARTLLTRAVEDNPHSVDIALGLADFFYQKQEFGSVDQLFSKLQVQEKGSAELSTQLGDFWALRGQLDRAVTFYELAASRTPEAFSIQKKLVTTYLPLQRVSDAERITQSLLARDHSDIEARSFQGALDYLHGDYASARQRLTSVLKEDPNSPFANFYLGLSLVAVGDSKDAQQAFRECIRINPQFADAYLKISEIALRNGDWGLALEDAQKAVSIDNRMRDAYLILAQAQMQKQDLPGATATLRQAEKLSPLPVEYYEVSAQLGVRKKNLTAAIQQYENAMKVSDHPIATLVHYAWFLLGHGQGSQAVARVRRYAETAPDDPSSYELLARLYEQLKQYENAEATCHREMERFPDRWNPHYILAGILRSHGHNDEALAEYEEALRRKPHQAEVLSDAGRLLLAQKQYSRARNYLDAALHEAPSSWEARNGMVDLYAESGENLDQALTLAQGLKNEKPTDPHIADTLGWIYYRKALYSLAVTELQSAAQALPQSAEVQFHLGMAYTDSGRTPQGRQALRRALQIGLSDPVLTAKTRLVLSQLGQN